MLLWTQLRFSSLYIHLKSNSTNHENLCFICRQLYYAPRTQVHSGNPFTPGHRWETTNTREMAYREKEWNHLGELCNYQWETHRVQYFKNSALNANKSDDQHTIPKGQKWTGGETELLEVTGEGFIFWCQAGQWAQLASLWSFHRVTVILKISNPEITGLAGEQEGVGLN